MMSKTHYYFFYLKWYKYTKCHRTHLPKTNNFVDFLVMRAEMNQQMASLVVPNNNFSNLCYHINLNMQVSLNNFSTSSYEI